MVSCGWIVVPCFNEEGNIYRLLTAIEDVLKKEGYKWQILCVNDGSADKTGEEIDQAVARFPNVHRIDHQQNRGFAQAIRTALNFLFQQEVDFVIFMDADFTHDPQSLPLFRKALEEGADMVVGSRYVRRGKMEKVPLWRRALSYGGNLFGRLLGVPVRDATSGYRAFNQKALALIAQARETDFSLQLEEILLCKAGKMKIVEVPITLGVREVGVSKFHYSLRLFFRYGRLLMRFWLRGRA